ncbi:MAG: hypothetical protein EAZ89_04460, partial [Bacteroidetes bacterium]
MAKSSPAQDILSLLWQERKLVAFLFDMRMQRAGFRQEELLPWVSGDPERLARAEAQGLLFRSDPYLFPSESLIEWVEKLSGHTQGLHELRAAREQMEGHLRAFHEAESAPERVRARAMLIRSLRKLLESTRQSVEGLFERLFQGEDQPGDRFWLDKYCRETLLLFDREPFFQTLSAPDDLMLWIGLAAQLEHTRKELLRMAALAEEAEDNPDLFLPLRQLRAWQELPGEDESALPDPGILFLDGKLEINPRLEPESLENEPNIPLAKRIFRHIPVFTPQADPREEETEEHVLLPVPIPEALMESFRRSGLDLFTFIMQADLGDTFSRNRRLALFMRMTARFE